MGFGIPPSCGRNQQAIGLKVVALELAAGRERAEYLSDDGFVGS
jgi:hypothetical protein